MAETTITLRLLDGDPRGLRVATIDFWNCQTFAAPKAQFKQLLQQPELAFAGVYFLLGSNGAAHAPSVYIGEAGSIKKRLPAHANKSWDQVIAFVSSSLHSSYAKYLEQTNRGS